MVRMELHAYILTRIKPFLVKGLIISSALPFLYGSTIFQQPHEINVPTSAKLCREPTFFMETEEGNVSTNENKTSLPLPLPHQKVHDLAIDHLNSNRSDESNYRFDVTNYFNHEEYITKKVEELIELEANYDKRVSIYRSASTFCIWATGLTSSASTIISILSSAEIIDPSRGTVITACFSAGSNVFFWAAGQFNKKAYKYDEESRKIKIALKVPRQIIFPSVAVDIEAPKFNGQNGNTSPSSKSINKSLSR